MKFLRTLEKSQLKGKRVILRADFNVPIVDGEVAGDVRIVKSLPTIEFLRDAGAKLVIVSHLGGENGKSLAPVATYLSRFTDIVFAPDIKSVETRHVVNSLSDGEAILFENLRNYPGEKNNDMQFAELLASFGDIYVNDAFSVSHRAHVSIVSLPTLLPSYAGLLFEEELTNMKEALDPEHPFVCILGGAKFDTKLPLIKKFLDKADTIFVGGALAHNVLVARGYSVGKSLVSKGDFNIEAIADNKKIIAPSEVIVKNGDEVLVKHIERISPDDVIVDAGEGTLEVLKSKITDARFILWNGPLGNYEEGFSEGTSKLAHMISETNAEALIGGGDTLTAMDQSGSEKSMHHVSTAGGAMLEFLISETLVGIEALG